MKKALLMAPMGSVHRRFNKANVEVLLSLGYQLHLLANFKNGDGPESKNGEYADLCRRDGIMVHSLSFCRSISAGNIYVLPALRKLLGGERYDLIHTHTETGGLLLRLCKGDANRAKLIYTPHGMSFYRGSSLKSQAIYRPIEHWICDGMNVNIALNDEEYAVLECWKEKSARLVHGVGLDMKRILSAKASCEDVRSGLGIPINAFLIVSVGELNKNKNHAVVIRALASLKETNIYYLICGVGPSHDQLLEIAKKYGLGGRVILAGYRKDVPQILHAADLFAFPSYHEGLPVSLLEAMTVGLPIICSAIRGNNDLVQDGYNGYLISGSDAAAYAARIIELYSDPEKRRMMAKNGIAYVQKYNIDHVKSQLKDIYLD